MLSHAHWQFTWTDAGARVREGRDAYQLHFSILPRELLKLLITFRLLCKIVLNKISGSNTTDRKQLIAHLLYILATQKEY
jgi:hypothetical protein